MHQSSTQDKAVSRYTKTNTDFLIFIGGPGKFFKASKENIDQLQEPLALSNSGCELGVPRAIGDAISVVGLLEERYLCVDSLCIIQDDEAMKHHQINNMAPIFANASITIIAKQRDDANYGLRGLSGISQPRNIYQDLFKLGNSYSVIKVRERDLTLYAWSLRGWKYQGELVSRRTLTFVGDSVRWDCACSSYQETKKTDGRADFDRILFHTSLNDISNYFP